jgi:hypothetical protein
MAKTPRRCVISRNVREYPSMMALDRDFDQRERTGV